MKNKEFYKLLKKNKPNSGFTLFELLVGLIMSGIVVGAFGFGLMQVLRISKNETSKINARTETARAMEFITEEIKRASAIESDSTNANAFNTSGKTVVLALDIPDITNNVNLDADADLLGSDTDTTTSERIVYYLQAASGNWRGPQVLYRWGPPLDENGNYTEETWQSEALIDALDNTSLSTSPCTGGDTLTPVLAEATAGFHACISSNNIAQLFFSGVTKDAQGHYGDSYSSNTKVFVRAKNSILGGEEDVEDPKLYFKTLGATYSCKVDLNDPNDPAKNSDWIVRTDFRNNGDDTKPDETTPWIHEANRQAQPIDIDTSQPLVITTSAVGQSGCLSAGNEGTTGGEDLSSYSHSVSFTIDFGNPTTYNGPGGNSDVTGDGFVKIYKKGETIAENKGYDPDNDSTTNNNQDSLGEFLESKGYAKCVSGSCHLVTDAEAQADPTKIALAANERIIAVELGQTDNGQSAGNPVNEAPWHPEHVNGQDDYYDRDGDGDPHPGFDVQDSVFILSNDAFDHSTP